MPTTTVITAPDLIELNNRAKKAGASRTLSDGVINRLDGEGLSLVSWSVGDDAGVRARLLLKLAGTDEPVEGMLDMSYADFNALPRLRKNQDGEWEQVEANA